MPLGIRGEEKLEQLPCEQFLHGFEIVRAFLVQNRWERSAENFQNPVKIAHKAVVFILLLSVSSFN